jgi:hypothetical protein
MFFKFIYLASLLNIIRFNIVKVYYFINIYKVNKRFNFISISKSVIKLNQNNKNKI